MQGVQGPQCKKLSPVPGVASVQEETFHALLQSLGLLRQVMEPFFARYGISGPQWAVLRVLHRAEGQGEGDLRLKDVGERLLIQPPSVTGVVDRLERMGLIHRTNSKSDLRVRRVGLTPEGRQLVQTMVEKHSRQIQSLFAEFSPQELETFSSLLGKWAIHLKDLANSHPGESSHSQKNLE